MEILQRATEKALREVPYQYLVRLISTKLADQGVTLSRRQMKLLLEHVRKGKSDGFTVHGWRIWERRRIRLDFTPQEIGGIEAKFTKFINDKLPDLVSEVAERASIDILDHLTGKWPSESRQQKRLVEGFERRLYSRWGPAIESLRMLLTISRELGARTNEKLRTAAEIAGRRHLVEVLTRSHARACQISEEVILLVCGGFASGAMARWRTMHEIAVVSTVLAAHGEDLAERYVLHQIVESKKAATEYEKCRLRLGYAPLGQKQIRKLENSFAALEKRFGREFTTPYGWASQHLGLSKPTLRDIEEAAGIDHLRSHYRMASHSVHANPKGIFFQLGLSNETQILLAGPSNAGLVDPIQNTALSLVQVTSSLCGLRSTLDSIVGLKMMMLLLDRIRGELVRADDLLKRDSAALGSSVQLC